jgi:hypothetical protein
MSELGQALSNVVTVLAMCVLPVRDLSLISRLAKNSNISAPNLDSVHAEF